ncbi:hypothetical protein [Mucilaginibacter sp. PAMB04168]|uniref:hypothetical protein n=1 Tax=Mucilaginibacter sp. PAMB04168 TaxID=3138567 RepID=UPI0031F62DA6
MDTPELACRIKSVRRKKRLVKTDLDKRLIQIHKRQEALWEKRRTLPWVPLDAPYQRGWKRFFVLRDDIRKGPKADFYEALLEKVNTFEYHHDRFFKRKKRRKGKYGYVVKKQNLRELDEYDWNSSKLALTEEEKACFTRTESFHIRTRRLEIKYVITEPWRFVLKVAPHIITHRKMVDTELESELSKLNNYVRAHNYDPRMHRLTSGKRYRWKDEFNERLKYINTLKNLPRYSQTAAYLDTRT